ncbi:MAG: hypothetical protein JWO05_337 [Gemmatimonadetes bacterium]|nr:hypothetical protein [Gemmatimonadota bacterium]
MIPPRPLAAALVLVAGACASVPKTATQETTGKLAPVNTWTGSFAPMLQSTGGGGQAGSNPGSGTQRLYGSASITATGRDGYYQVHLSLTSPRGAESLSWSVVPGRCGSGGLPIVQPSNLPPLEMRAAGNGDITAEVPFTLESTGGYHVNIYQGGGNNLEAVIACANMRFARK